MGLAVSAMGKHKPLGLKALKINLPVNERSSISLLFYTKSASQHICKIVRPFRYQMYDFIHAIRTAVRSESGGRSCSVAISGATAAFIVTNVTFDSPIKHPFVLIYSLKRVVKRVA